MAGLKTSCFLFSSRLVLSVLAAGVSALSCHQELILRFLQINHCLGFSGSFPIQNRLLNSKQLPKPHSSEYPSCPLSHLLILLILVFYALLLNSIFGQE